MPLTKVNKRSSPPALRVCDLCLGIPKSRRKALALPWPGLDSQFKITHHKKVNRNIYRSGILLVSLFLMAPPAYSERAEHPGELKPVIFAHHMAARVERLLPNRHLVAQKLWNIFLKPGLKQPLSEVETEAYRKIYAASVYQILLHPAEFGGPCGPYRAEDYSKRSPYLNLPEDQNFKNGCPQNTTPGTSFPFLTQTTVLRSALFARACDSLLYPDPQISDRFTHREVETTVNALTVAGLTIDDKIDTDNLAKIWDVFHPGVPLESAQNLSLIELSTKLPNSLPRKWQGLIYTLCRTADQRS